MNGTMHMEAADRASRRIDRSSVTWLLAAIVVLVVAIVLAAGPASSTVRAPIGTPTPAPTVCTADGMTGPCS
jgi:hypothetical protein